MYTQFHYTGKFSLDWKLHSRHCSFLKERIFPCHAWQPTQEREGVFVARPQLNEKQDEAPRVLDVTGVKVFSATKAKERELLGEIITDWIRSNPNYDIVDKIVTQSSDSEFHCLTITLFYKAKS